MLSRYKYLIVNSVFSPPRFIEWEYFSLIVVYLYFFHLLILFIYLFIYFLFIYLFIYLSFLFVLALLTQYTNWEPADDISYRDNE